MTDKEQRLADTGTNLYDICSTIRNIQGEAHLRAALIGANVTAGGKAYTEVVSTLIASLPESELSRDSLTIFLQVTEIFGAVISMVRTDLVQILMEGSGADPGTPEGRAAYAAKSNALAADVKAILNQTVQFPKEYTNEAKPDSQSGSSSST